MQLRLQDFVDIRVGFTLRGKDASLKTDEAGLPLLRISDLTQDGRIQIESPHLIPRDEAKDQFRVRPNDILVANRGVRMTAALIPDGLEAIVGGQLFYLRLRRKEITPGYLHWFLNLSSTQTELLSRTKGSYVKNLSITNFRDLEVPIPSLQKQAQIVQVAQLAHREKSLSTEIIRKRAAYTEGLLQKLATR